MGTMHRTHRKGNINNAEEGHNSLCPYKNKKQEYGIGKYPLPHIKMYLKAIDLEV